MNKYPQEDRFKELMKDAESGDGKAMLELANYYYTTGDPYEAANWLIRANKEGRMLISYDSPLYAQVSEIIFAAAKAGHSSAQSAVGAQFEKEGNFEEGFEWRRKAAEQGLAEAQFSLGMYYDEGIVVIQNKEQAIKWYEKAANQGFAPAQNNLAIMYENGEGVTQNYQKALELYRKAAEQGLVEAQYSLERMYQTGKGIK